MVEVADIVDRESLRNWLKGQPKEASVWIARRAAMRLLPYYWIWAAQSKRESKDDLAVLSFLRFYLIWEVLRIVPTANLAKYAVDAAVDASAVAVPASIPSTLRTVVTVDTAAAYAATAAINAAAAAVNKDAANVAVSSVVGFSPQSSWKAIREDCGAIGAGINLDGLGLWIDISHTGFDVWESVKKQLLIATSSPTDETKNVVVDWSFWIKWYDDALKGIPPNWDMLERIALIDPKEWDKGAKVVNPLIAEIQLRYELKEQIAGLEAKLQSASVAMRGMGDNQGPPLDAPIAKELLVIWEPLQELKQQTEIEAPNKSQVLEIAKKLLSLSITLGKWAAGKVDKAVDAFAVAAGTATVGFAITWYTQDAGTVAGMLSKIADIAGKWAVHLQ